MTTNSTMSSGMKNWLSRPMPFCTPSARTAMVAIQTIAIMMVIFGTKSRLNEESLIWRKSSVKNDVVSSSVLPKRLSTEKNAYQVAQPMIAA